HWRSLPAGSLSRTMVQRRFSQALRAGISPGGSSSAPAEGAAREARTTAARILRSPVVCTRNASLGMVRSRHCSRCRDIYGRPLVQVRTGTRTRLSPELGSLILQWYERYASAGLKLSKPWVTKHWNTNTRLTGGYL